MWLRRVGLQPLLRPAFARGSLRTLRISSRERTWTSFSSTHSATAGRVGSSAVGSRSLSESASARILTAAKEGDVDTLTSLVQQDNTLLSVTDEHGRNALHLAAIGDRNKAVAALLSAGADPDAQDAQGKTALHHSMFQGYTAVVVALYNSGADDKILDAEGKTAGQITEEESTY